MRGGQSYERGWCERERGTLQIIVIMIITTVSTETIRKRMVMNDYNISLNNNDNSISTASCKRKINLTNHHNTIFNIQKNKKIYLQKINQ